MQKKRQKLSNKLLLVLAVIVVVGVLFVALRRGDVESISGDAIAALEDKAAANKLATKTVKLAADSDVIDKVTERVGIGGGIASNTQPEDYFDNPLRDNDLAILQSTEITYNSGGGYDDYSVSDELWFGANSPSIETSLSKASVDKDYKDDVALEVATDSIVYYYSFDDTINLSMISEAHPVEIRFWGKDIKITGVSWDGAGTADRVTVKVGETFYMSVGDEINVKGHTLVLKDVGEGIVALSMDGGEVVTIEVDDTHAFPGGMEAAVDSVFYKSGDPTTSTANVIFGEDATKTFKDGDEFIGEDESNEYWQWEIDNLQQSASTDITAAGTATGPVLAMKNHFVVSDASDDDPAPIVNSGCYDITVENPYAQICMDGLTVSNYMTLEIDFQSVNLDDAGFNYVGVTRQVLQIKSSASDGLRLDQSNIQGTAGFIANDVETDEIYLMLNNTAGVNPLVEVFYIDPSTNDVTIAGNLTAASTQPFAYVDYDDTRGTDVIFGFQGVDAANRFSLNITAANGEIPGTTDRIGMYVTNSSATVFNGVANMLHVNDMHNIDISTQDEDLRTDYGIVIKDPDSHVTGNDPEFEIPGDAVRAKVSIKAYGEVITTTSEETQLASAITSTAAINTGDKLVGGPAANKWTAQAMGVDFPTLGGALGWTPGWCHIKDYSLSGKTLTVIAGYSKEDTSNCVDLYNSGERDRDGVAA